MRRFDNQPGGEPPEDLTAWLAEGLRRAEAMQWRRWNFTLEEARQWRTVGIGEALTAAQWHAAGVDPATVADWTDANITPRDAVSWHELGFDLATAREHTRNGRGPNEAYDQGRRNTPRAARMGIWSSQEMSNLMRSGAPHEVVGSYAQMSWLDDDAVPWAREYIKAWDAKAWLSIGLTAAEAGELQKAGSTPMQVVQDWWRSGIPFDEVADWLGAGLTPAEAVEQRGCGVTVEQAAALRALRRGGML